MTVVRAGETAAAFAHRGHPRRATLGVYNFSAGPGVMPREVLAAARDEMLDWRGTGVSVWELPFTARPFREDIYHDARTRLARLLGLPSEYRLLFLPGGASLQFGAVPLNLLRGRRRIAFLDTGHWARKAISEARRYASVDVLWSGASESYARLPEERSWEIAADTAYCHVTPNETADGLEFHWVPDTGEVPLVADMTSCFLTRPHEVRRFGLIYAGAQKNIGPAGLTVVVVREDLVAPAAPETPSPLSLHTQVASDGLFNTPPTYAIYLAGLVFRWIEDQGGLRAMERASLTKSGKLYAAIGGFYRSPIAVADRSRVNVRFHLASPELENQFFEAAEAEGLVNLRGHSALGGIRASLYNAMPEAGVDALVAFMKEFERRHG